MHAVIQFPQGILQSSRSEVSHRTREILRWGGAFGVQIQCQGAACCQSYLCRVQFYQERCSNGRSIQGKLQAGSEWSLMTSFTPGEAAPFPVGSGEYEASQWVCVGIGIWYSIVWIWSLNFCFKTMLKVSFCRAHLNSFHLCPKMAMSAALSVEDWNFQCPVLENVSPCLPGHLGDSGWQAQSSPSLRPNVLMLKDDYDNNKVGFWWDACRVLVFLGFSI